jgi:hypothetical protein
MAKKECPDGGACHHNCTDQCFRVRYCKPLSGVYPNDEWPDEVKKAHGTQTPEPGQYRHFKGGLYRVIGVGKHTEHPDSERFVVYHPLDDPTKIWLRPVTMWFDTKVDPKTGQDVPRFQKLSIWVVEALRKNPDLFTSDEWEELRTLILPRVKIPAYDATELEIYCKGCGYLLEYKGCNPIQIEVDVCPRCR